MNFLKYTLAAFLTLWLLAHASYAFVQLEWTWFTEWQPLTRGQLLASFLTLAVLFACGMMDRRP